MLLKRTIIAALCGGALAPLPALCQETPAYKTEISIEASMPFVKNTVAYGVQQSAGLNGGFLAGYRFFFGKHSGAELTYGYARNSQTYSLASGPGGVRNNSDEGFAAYVFRFPRKRWSPFVLAGWGGAGVGPTTEAGADTHGRVGSSYRRGAAHSHHGRIVVTADAGG